MISEDIKQAVCAMHGKGMKVSVQGGASCEPFSELRFGGFPAGSQRLTAMFPRFLRGLYLTSDVHMILPFRHDA
jgi:hypothetical protein